MKIISQTGKYDFPYEQALISLNHTDYEINVNCMNNSFVAASYDSKGKRDEVMKNLRKAYEEKLDLFYFPKNVSVDINKSITIEEYKSLNLSENGTLLASYSYEYNDGDQIWEDNELIYEYKGDFYHYSQEGYYGKINIYMMSYKHIEPVLIKWEIKTSQSCQGYVLTEDGRKYI